MHKSTEKEKVCKPLTFFMYMEPALNLRNMVFSYNWKSFYPLAVARSNYVYISVFTENYAPRADCKVKKKSLWRKSSYREGTRPSKMIQFVCVDMKAQKHKSAKSITISFQFWHSSVLLGFTRATGWNLSVHGWCYPTRKENVQKPSFQNVKRFLL